MPDVIIVADDNDKRNRSKRRTTFDKKSTMWYLKGRRTPTAHQGTAHRLRVLQGDPACRPGRGSPCRV
ncbi:hypothetical protein Rcas_0609 [Roseiflexus castenholzii DSM 13941]|uniref:Uncharacterized protein n=1 Tax=Roseiflexus castenholzii (strain DSM 13941 / HLO8) TaxID=383372 RepID=A7NGZ1_ROSCS|nr:hypothetical protein Rcas_0609 [Roseiflexus castenholzii DSM 13941]